MPISPAPRRHPPNQPPTEADQAQATVVADMLARLISECDARLAALDIDAAQAARDGALRTARGIHARSLELRRELDQLHTMEHRLVRRFFDSRGSLTVVPSA